MVEEKTVKKAGVKSDGKRAIKVAITAILLIPFLGAFVGVKLGSYPTLWFIVSMAAILSALCLILWLFHCKLDMI